jgi:hypothetical protein
MRFSVSVPVLSTHITVMAPRLSTAARRLTSVPRRRMRSMPSASVVVATAGSPSGTAATASETALRSISSAGTPRSRPRPRAAAHAPSETPTNRRPVASSWRSSGVAEVSVSATSARIFPSSVVRPVAVTTAVAEPSVTIVPAYTMLARSASAPFDGKTAVARFTTGTLSPVRADSSTASPSASITRASAGTSCPTRSSRTSPGTTAWADSASSAPSRRTRARSSRPSWSEVRMRSTRRSVRYPITPLAMITARITAASRAAPVSTDSAAAPPRSTTGIELTCPAMMSSGVFGCGTGSRLPPTVSSRPPASALDSPRSADVASRRTTSGPDRVCQAVSSG